MGSVLEHLEQQLASAKDVEEAWGWNHKIVSKVGRQGKSLCRKQKVIELGVGAARCVGVGERESFSGQKPN